MIPFRFLTTAPVSILPMYGVKVSDLFFSSPWFSTFDDWKPISSDESPCRTILIRFWADQTHVYSICTDFPRFHRMGFVSSIIEFRPILNRIPECCHFEERLWINRHNSRQNHWPKWPGSIRWSVKQSVFLEGNGLLCELFVPPDWPFFWSENNGWFCSVLKQSSHRVPQSLVHEFLL